jgi:phosphatidylserine/phosphatidylglycerophosphate/cardiolipin synthase-like enzyme
MVIDDELGFVESLNWETRDITETRDYAVTTTNKHEVGEMVACFEADWAHEKFTPDPGSKLIWCPNNGRERISEFINAAKHTLWIQNERYQDTVVIEHLVRAAARGVKIHILAKAAHKVKTDKLVEGIGGLRIMADVGAKIHRLKGLKLHAKMLLADDKLGIVGSINLTPGSFDSRRELAIETDSHQVVSRLKKTADHDWQHSVPLDLSDEGLLADLAKSEGGAEKLGIVDHHHDKDHKKKH